MLDDAVVLGRVCPKGHNEWAERWNSSRNKAYWYCRRCAREYKRDRDRDPKISMLSRAKVRAARKGLPFTITLADIEAVWPQNGKCPVLNLAFMRGAASPAMASPSLERLDPQRGYEPDNIAIISFRANQLRNSATVAELEAVLTWMRNNGAN
jgi:hypothetical protein